ncbi:MAG: helix-turn-helix transcriptional regulator [Acidobacteria bacterium]|nr:helix-turn-helix transcriptional regulator [Acidobacteriota bacterium]
MDAAYRLWSQEGEEALTMRAVARAAKTTTPTVYQRFRDKRDLKHFLEARARQKMFDALQTADRALEVCRNALQFIADHSNEYRLITMDWGTRYARRVPMRSFEYLMEVLAKELGGEPEEHEELALQLITLVHGSALLCPTGKGQEQVANVLQEACLRSCSVLIRDSASRKKTRSS